MYRAVSTQ